MTTRLNERRRRTISLGLRTRELGAELQRVDAQVQASISELVGAVDAQEGGQAELEQLHACTNERKAELASFRAVAQEQAARLPQGRVPPDLSPRVQQLLVELSEVRGAHAAARDALAAERVSRAAALGRTAGTAAASPRARVAELAAARSELSVLRSTLEA